jgi:hypothetical protein
MPNELLEIEVEESEAEEILSSPWNEEYRALSDKAGVAGWSLRIPATTTPCLLRRLRDSDALKVVNMTQVS